jgi:glycerol kinase
MPAPLILAIDQGTSATKCLAVDRAGAIVARGTAPVAEAHPQPGWVEQDAGDIWRSVQAAVAACLDGLDPRAVVAIGLSTQRESLLLWDRASGTPRGAMLSWQDQRGAAHCDALRAAGHAEEIRARSGLPLDPMFSAAKAHWLLRAHGARGACLGTVDSWLLSRFGGAHVIEAGNASRTQLLRVADASWDAALLDWFEVPRETLPRVVASTGPYPAARGLPPLPDGVPVLAVMGDSHAALYAHGAGRAGVVKATFGTGCSVMGLVAQPEHLDPGLSLTIAWQTQRPHFAAEGNIRASGAALRWAARLCGRTPEAMAALADTASSDGVVLVPGFNGLAAPYWDNDAVGLLANLRLDTGPPQLARAALEAMAQQAADVVAALERSAGPIESLHADGGPTRSDTLMQVLADLLDRPVARAPDAELSALGAAHLAGIGAGLWSEATLAERARPREVFRPASDAAARTEARARWHRAVARARSS